MTNNQKKLKVLVVDDTIIYRKIVSDLVAEINEVEVIGTANNGKIAISKIHSLLPDLLILDVEMPEVNGIEVLQYIKEKSLQVGAIMLSSVTSKGSKRTVEALEFGAFDFISKPETDSIANSKAKIKQNLTNLIKAYTKQIQPAASGSVSSGNIENIKAVKSIARDKNILSKAICIGISTGGPSALQTMLPSLPKDINVPVFIVQHMPAVFTKSLADSLNKKCQLEVIEAKDGDKVLPNQIMIAPGGKQMKIVRDGAFVVVKITDDPPENSCKPSVDYTFRSVANIYGQKTTAVIMTGMGNDGKLGMNTLKQAGAVTIAQNQETCVVYGMPKEVIETGIVDTISPLNLIADEICKTVDRKQAIQC